jgi:hypothetical protein
MNARSVSCRLGPAAALVAAATAASYVLGWVAGAPWLLPILNTLAAFPVMVACLRGGAVRRAVAVMLVWALVMAVCATALSWWRPDGSERLILNGAAYRQEMFAWVRTGIGAESEPSRFLPQHLLHGSVFAALSLATGSALSMPMGAVLMNYMGHYVGTLAARSATPLATALLAWPPWALVRVASFVVLGVVLAGPVLGRVFGFAFAWRDQRRLLAAGLAGLVVDATVKWLLAPWWSEMLRARLGW